MTPSTVPVESFGGLNLADDAGEVGWNGAVDLLNIDFDHHGRIRTRDGWSLIAGTAAANIDSLFPVYTTATNYYLVGTTTPTLQVFDSAFVAAQTVNRIGGGTGTTQTATAGPHNFCSFGTPTTEYVYIGNGTNQVRRFEPSTLTFTEPAGLATVKGRCLAITPWDNRLAIEGDTDKSRVAFSDAGDPETFGANNYVDLTPGDGERIVAIKAWRDLLFVFKRTKFFVFYGTSTDSTGNPIFNYRTVDAGQGVDSTTYGQRAVAPGPDGLYFVNALGIWVTRGGGAEKFSGLLDPAFLGTTSSFTSLAINAIAGGDDVALCWVGNRLIFGTRCGNSGDMDTLFVFDRSNSRWTAWSLPASVKTVIGGRMGSVALEYIIIGAATVPLANIAAGTTDNGTAITSRYRSGFSDLGSADIKTIREWELQGSGTPALKVSTDFGSLDTGATVTMGTAPAIDEGRRRYATRGRQHSWQVGGTSAWSLNSLIAYVREKRAPGTQL